MSSASEPLIEDSAARARAASRRRAALWTTASAFVVRLVSSLSTLMSVPLLVGYFGQERYGVFATLLSFGPLLMLVDFGLALGVTTAVARAVGSGDDAQLRGLVASASAWCLTVCLVVLGIGLVAVPYVDWTSLFNASDAFDKTTLRSMVLVAGVLFLVQTWGNLGSAIVRGLQAGHLANAAVAISAVTSLGASALTIKLGGSPLALTAAFLAPTALAPLVLWIVCAWRDPRIRPFGPLSAAVVTPLVRVGLGYFVLQAASLCLSQFDLIILARARGGADVTPYSVAMRLTGAGAAFLAAYLTSLWPAYAEAAARGDWDWVQRTHRRSRLGVTGVAVLGALAFIVIGPFIVEKLAGAEAVAPRAMYAFMALTLVLRVWTDCHAYLLNGLGRIRVQVAISVAHAAVSLTLAVFLTNEYGVVGLAAATALGFLLVSAWAIPRAASRINPS